MVELSTQTGRTGRVTTAAAAEWEPLADVDQTDTARIPTGIGELDRVLGGGMVPGSYIVLGAEPGAGKALALDTPIPTPDGWSTMADLQVGDSVFTAQGTITQVTAVTDIMYNHDVYRVVFDDGSEIVADAQHQWAVSTTADESPQIQTTQELADTLADNSYFVAVTKPLQLPPLLDSELCQPGASDQYSLASLRTSYPQRLSLWQALTAQQATTDMYQADSPQQAAYAAELACSLGLVVCWQTTQSFVWQQQAVRQIARIEQHASIPVRCLEVADPSHLFLAGKQMIPTHNSTLASQVLISASRAGKKVAMVSGEESFQQILMRFERLGEPKPNVLVTQDLMIENIVASARKERFDLLVVDSIQTVHSEAISGGPGSISQIRECGHQLVEVAKDIGTSIILIGQVTKEGALAGPRALEHLVDVVLSIEGERDQQMRILRAAKNRFGTTDEAGVFEMQESGMMEVADPSSLFVSQRANPVVGSVVCATLEGTRPVLVEVQALCNTSGMPMPIRAAHGINPKRLQMLLAVLSRRLGYALGTQDIFINLGGGLQVQEPAIDLAVCIAIASAITDRAPVPNLATFAEVSLMGELRPIKQSARRASEASRLGYTTIIDHQAETVQQAIELALQPE